jgi:phage-related protein
LSANNIFQLSKWGFRKLPQLNSINVSGNKLKTLPGKIFDNTKNIENVDFSNNNVAKMSNNIFDKQHWMMKTLNLEKNKISWIGRVSKIFYLTSNNRKLT